MYRYEFHTRPLVIYHANCMDGFTAAWAAHCFFKRQDGITPEYLPMNYGEPFDMLRAAHRPVFMLDFSFKRDRMIALLGIAAYVVVLDHHQTAEAELKDLELPNDRCKIEFVKDFSGAWLAWNFFNSPTPTPMLVDYVQDRDLWRWELDFSHEINAALASYEPTFDLWDNIVWSGNGLMPTHLVVEGEALLRANKKTIQLHVERAVIRPIEGYMVPVVNATVLHSEIAGALAIGHPFAACYFDRKDGNRQFSLRSTPEGIDVSEIAKQFNGGGHRNAAGFEMLMVRADDLA